MVITGAPHWETLTDMGWFSDLAKTHTHTAIKESVAKLSFSKLFNLSPRGEQRKTQCCA